MTHEFEEFHDELRSVAGDLLAKDGEVGWPLLVDAGWTGLEVSDDLGGAGATFGEVAIVCEEMGRAASTNSYLGSAVLAVGVLNALQPSGIRDALLSDVASGTGRVAVALEPFEFVPDAEGADRLLVVTTDADGTPIVVDTAGVTVTPQPVVDETRRLAAVSVDGIEPGNVLRFDGDPEAASRPATRSRGGGRRLRQPRTERGDAVGDGVLREGPQPVRSADRFFSGGQARLRRHARADLVSRQLVGAAVEAIAHDAEDAGVAASMAKSYACTAAVDIAGKAMQLHGGIGYTWESGIHVYLKRAALNRSLFGSPAAHRKRLSQRYV